MKTQKTKSVKPPGDTLKIYPDDGYGRDSMRIDVDQYCIQNIKSITL